MKYLNSFYILFLFLIVLGSIVLVSCNTVSTESNEQATLSTVTSTRIELLQPTNVKTPPNELMLRNSQKLLLNVTNDVVELDTCYPLGSTEIWEAVFPFTEKQVLLPSNSRANYFAPTYSPNGQWIAYIESKPVVWELSLGSTTTPNPSGTTSIWIMSKDGSEHHRVSTIFDSYSIKDLHYCYPYSRINSSLTWSPDSKYIFYEYYWGSASDNHLNYYILNVETKESYLINSSKWDTMYSFAWLGENGQFIYQNDDGYWINQITPKGIDESKKSLLPLSLISTDGKPYFEVASALGVLILITHNEGTNDWVLMNYNIDQKNWSKSIEYTAENQPIFGTYWGIYLSDSNINFIDLKTWEFEGSIHDRKVENLRYYFPELIDSLGNPIVSFISEDTNDIWGANPEHSTMLYQIVDWDSLDSEKIFSIIEYSWCQ